MLNKYLLPFYVFIILLAFLWRGLYLEQREPTFALQNQVVPSFQLTALNNTLATQEIFFGKKSILHVWSSSCSACNQDHELFNTVFKTDEFQLVGLNYKDLPKMADLWLHKNGNPYRVILFDREGNFGMDLGVIGTPTTFIIDSSGIVRYRHVGVLTKEIWNAKILPAINSIT